MGKTCYESLLYESPDLYGLWLATSTFNWELYFKYKSKFNFKYWFPFWLNLVFNYYHSDMRCEKMSSVSFRDFITTRSAIYSDVSESMAKLDNVIESQHGEDKWG